MSRDTEDSSICNTCAAPVWWRQGATASSSTTAWQTTLFSIWWRHCAASPSAMSRRFGRVLESYFRDRDSLEPVSREKLLQQSRAGTVAVLDVRPEDSSAASPAAVHDFS
jgi:hypothetical protein